VEVAEKDRMKVRWARLSVVSNTCLVVFKVAVGVFGGSVSILAEAIHSGNDLIAAVIAYGAVRKSSKPPDSDHGFGHGKYENLSGLVEAGLIIVAGVSILWESVRRILEPQPVEHIGLGIAVMGVSAVVNLFVARKLLSVARQTDSIAIETDGHHLMVDVWTSVGVMVGLALLAATGLDILDPIVSTLVAIYILWLGIGLTRRAGRDLLDAELPESEITEIRRIIADKSHAIATFHKLATRKAGGTRMIDVHILVHGEQSVRRAHDLVSHIEQDLRERFPGARTMVHVEPCENECEFCGVVGCSDDRRSSSPENTI
jgi:cation diffusion facilitator family transporter